MIVAPFKARIATAALAVASCAVALVVAEVVCALVSPNPMVQGDILGRRIQEISGNSYRTLQHGSERYQDLRPGSEGRARMRGDYDIRWTVNSLGLRQAEVPEDKATLRILVLGDSQTFGQGVEQDGTFCARLEALLRDQTREPIGPIAVLNAGVPGYGTYEELWKLERIAETVRPGIVLVVANVDNALVPDEGNDLWNNYERMRSRVEGPRLAAPTPRVPFLARHSHLYTVLSRARRKLAGEPTHVERVRDYRLREARSPELASVWDETRRLLKDIERVAASTSGSRTLVAYLPGLASLELGDQSALEELRKSRLPVVSLFTALERGRQGRTESLRFRLDSHYNAFAHGLIAEALREELLRGGYVR